MLINKINNFLKQYENRNSEQSSFGNIQVISVIRGSIYSNGSFQTDQIIIDNKTISNGIDDTNILGDVTTFNRNNEHSDIEEESSHNMSKEHSEDNLHKDYMNIKPDLTRNVSFVQYEKKKYNDMNASFIK